MHTSPEQEIASAVRAVVAELGAPDAHVQLERPRDPSHGDWASNVALALASRLRRPPRQIAVELAERLGALDGVAAIEVAGPGFLNFRLDAAAAGAPLRRILAQDADYGRSDHGRGRRIMVEFVSANPTGPLHLGHGRQAALGDAIANLLQWTGWHVHREFYFNDAGRQMDRLAASVRARCLQATGRREPVPDDGYHGEYVSEIAQALLEEVQPSEAGLPPPEEVRPSDAGLPPLDEMRRFAVARVRREQEADLEAFGVRFDRFYSETSLYDEGRVDATVRALDETGLTYRQDGAAWLRTTDFGDQKDRVMLKGDGSPTYFLPDVAYHMSKWERGFHHVVNVQGADHHSTVDRVRAGLQALGRPAGYPEYVLHQMVTVERGGQEVRFSKRAGSYTTLAELVAATGFGVARYFFLMRRPEAHLAFDLDVALDRSDKNPVYKVQYAHARLCRLLDLARRRQPLAESLAGDSPAGDSPAGDFPDGADANLSLLADPLERELAGHLAEFPGFVARAAANRAPQIVCGYLEKTAGLVNSWYQAGHPSRRPELAALVDDGALRQARLALVRAARIVLRNGLTVLGVPAPERMHRQPDADANAPSAASPGPAATPPPSVTPSPPATPPPSATTPPSPSSAGSA